MSPTEKPSGVPGNIPREEWPKRVAFRLTEHEVRMKTFFPAVLFLAACSGAGPETRQAPVMQAFIPTGPGPELASAAKGRRPEPTLASGDLLRITVYRQPDLDLEVR